MSTTYFLTFKWFNSNKKKKVYVEGDTERERVCVCVYAFKCGEMLRPGESRLKKKAY